MPDDQTNDKENSATGLSDVMSGRNSSTPCKASEAALQSVVTSLVDDAMAAVNDDVMDVKTSYVNTPTAVKAERIFGM